MSHIGDLNFKESKKEAEEELEEGIPHNPNDDMCDCDMCTAKLDSYLQDKE